MPMTAEEKRAKAREYERKRYARLKAEKDAAKASPPPDTSGFTAAAPPPRVERKRKGQPKEVNEAALRSLHETVSLAVGFLGVALISEPDKRMTESEKEAIFYPLERMYLRHASVPEVSPDTQDVVAAATGLFMYLMRIGALNAVIGKRGNRSNTRAGASGQAPQNNGGNGRGMGGPSPGGHQGDSRREGAAPVQGSGPRTPEQILEQLARDSYVADPDAA